MTDCPYCHSAAKIRYSPIISLHIVRSIIGSDKRYCAQCEKKWKVRSHRKRINTSFYTVAVPLTLLFSLGMLRMTDLGAHAAAQADNPQDSRPSAGSALQKMALGSEVFFAKAVLSKAVGNTKAADSQMLAGLSGSQRKMAEKALKTMSKEDIQNKLQKLQTNPQALSRISGERREVVEQALKMMKNQSRRK